MTNWESCALSLLCDQANTSQWAQAVSHFSDQAITCKHHTSLRSNNNHFLTVNVGPDMLATRHYKKNPHSQPFLSIRKHP